MTITETIHLTVFWSVSCMALFSHKNYLGKVHICTSIMNMSYSSGERLLSMVDERTQHTRKLLWMPNTALHFVPDCFWFNPQCYSIKVCVSWRENLISEMLHSWMEHVQHHPPPSSRYPPATVGTPDRWSQHPQPASHFRTIDPDKCEWRLLFRTAACVISPLVSIKDNQPSGLRTAYACVCRWTY